MRYTVKVRYRDAQPGSEYDAWRVEADNVEDARAKVEALAAGADDAPARADILSIYLPVSEIAGSHDLHLVREHLRMSGQAPDADDLVDGDADEYMDSFDEAAMRAELDRREDDAIEQGFRERREAREAS